MAFEKFINYVCDQLTQWFLAAIVVAFYEKDPEKKDERHQKFLTETVAPHIAIIEKHLVKNGTGFLVGDEVKLG